MKIRPDQIQTPRETDSRSTQKVRDGADSFQELLERASATGDSGQAKAASAAPPPLRAEPLMDIQAPAATSAPEQTIMHDLENLLDDWENYAANLEQSGAGLKDAYGMLERIQGEVSRLKDQGAVTANPQLQSLVDELEILTVTETIKFNRGDYV